MKVHGSGSPLVTVYVTNHNYGRFIEQAIRSVLNQTLSDLELIVIDDGSTDDSRTTIERYASHEKVIAVFQENRGLNVTNNIALRMARGRYIMRLDADDYLDENALMVLSGVLDRNPDVGLVFPDYFLVDENGAVLEVVRRHDFSEVTLLDQPAHGACTMIRRHDLLELGGYDELFKCQDGYDLWLRFIKHKKVQNVNLPLFYYRQHFLSLTQNEERLLATRSLILERRANDTGSALAVVPVRGRSVDPESPALRLLGNRPLIDWTLEVALAARQITDVVVTTPDDDLLGYVRDRFPSVIPVRRDRNLALPNTRIEDTVFHAFSEYTKSHSAPEVVVVLYVESPFRRPSHIDSAIRLISLFDTDSVVAVRPETDVFYQHNGAGLVPVRKTRVLRLERDELYREVGQLYAVRREFFESERAVVGGRIGHVVVDHDAALSLRSEWAWEIAQLQAAKKMKVEEQERGDAKW